MTNSEHIANHPHASTIEVMEEVVAGHTFDNFLHFKELARFGKEANITPDQWPVLLAEWPYDPLAMMQKERRGNCVDFAIYTQTALGAAGIRASLIGKGIEFRTSPQGERIAYQRHIVAMSGTLGARFIHEPGRRLVEPIPIDPAGNTSQFGHHTYTTLEIGDTEFTQRQSFRDTGYSGTRSFLFDPMTPQDATNMVRALFRLPRNMEMIARPTDGQSPPQIEYDRHTHQLRSNIAGLPTKFQPSEIPTSLNEKISSIFGFDVKEELVAAMGIVHALPTSFWVR